MTTDSGASATSDPGVTVAAVARRMGVAPATLRTWDRRYGIGPSEHRPGSHRRYSTLDVARLEHMRRLVIAGVPPADAAVAARALSLDDEGVASVTPLPLRAAPAALSGTGPETAKAPRAGGGHVVALPGGSPELRGLARAAQTLDTAACAALIGRSLDHRGVVATWDEVLVPVLCAIGEKWKDTGRGVEIEHALSATIQDCLSAVVRTQPQTVNSRAVLLACAPDEMHSLPLWAVAAALAERKIYARIMGSGLPVVALVQAVHRLGPAAVFVWARIPGSADAAALADLPSFRPAATVLIGGPGWVGQAPPGVTTVTDLSDTVARIARAVGE
ncbi:MAG: MerR family transcriptional regulator [Actinobacteria bacterium]|nr:MerR family transcriptional regulator [Actinomycetota bacterium]